MNILLSAYACEPGKGSEPGVGWRWAVELAQLGHHVWVITRQNNRESIEYALSADEIENIQFFYYDLPGWGRWWKKWPGGIYLYNLIWQIGAYRLAARLAVNIRLDFVQHITFGVFRQPSFMGLLGVPFVFGPVGGGERAPYALRRSYPLRGQLLDSLRDVANLLPRINPLTRLTYRSAGVILCKTRESLRQLPEVYHWKCRVQLEIGIDLPAPARNEFPVHDEFRLLYVGRLIYWKGLHLVLAALARVRLENPTVRLTVVGSGPDEKWLHKVAQRLQLEESIEWHPWLPHHKVLAMYGQHAAFVFPSLHDSSGNVVLEALACGLPAICLDLGGPGVIIDESCGLVIETSDRSESEVVDHMSRGIRNLSMNSDLRRHLSSGAIKRASRFNWRAAVMAVYSEK